MAETTQGQDEIVLPIHLSTEDAERALADFRTRATAAGQQTAQGFDQGARAAGGGTKSLIGALQEYRREQTQSSRAARFFAAELMSIVPGASAASDSTRQLVNVLIEGVAGGSAFAVGFELVKLSIGFVTESLRESAEASKKFGEEMKRAREEQRRQLEEATEATRVAALVSLGYADAQVTQIRKMQEADRAAKSAAASLQIVTDEIAELRANPYIGSENRVAQLTQEKAKYEQAAAAAAAFRTQLEILRAQQAENDRRAQAALATKAIYETGQADRKAANEAQLARLEMSKRFADERQVIEIEGNAKITKLVQDAASAQNRITRASLEEQADFERQKLADRLELYDAFQRAQQSRAVAVPFREAPAEELLKVGGGAGNEEAAKREADVRTKMQALQALGASSLDVVRQKYEEEIRIIEDAAALQVAGASTFEEVERLKTEALARYSEQRIAIWKKETFAGQQLEMVERRLADAIGAQFAKVATHARAYERAMRASGKAEAETASEREGAILKWVQETMAALSQAAAVESVFQLAKGFALLAVGDPKATAAFTSAAIFAGVAGVAAAAGYGIGEYRPMTQDERQASRPDGVGSGAAGGAREAGGAGATGGTQVMRDMVIVYVADPFETPQEAARRAANRVALARRLNMFPAEAT